MDSCGLPFSISNLAETGLPFFLLVFRPSSSVTLALATIGASSAFSLSVIAALPGIAHKAIARTDKDAIGIFGIATSLRYLLFGILATVSRVESRHSLRQRQCVRSKAVSGSVFTPTREADGKFIRLRRERSALMSRPTALQRNPILPVRMLRPARRPVNFEGFVRITGWLWREVGDRLTR